MARREGHRPTQLLTTLAVSLAVGLFLESSGCTKKPAAKALEDPTSSTREPPPDLPFGEPDPALRPANIPDGADEDADAAEAEANARDEADAYRTLKLQTAITNVDEAKQVLATAWEDLEVSCWSMEGCFQIGDLDADGSDDAVVMVKQLCEVAPCPVGVVVFGSRGEHVRLGAGIDPTLPWWEWELAETKKGAKGSAPIEWTAGAGAQAGRDWVDTASLVVSPRAGETACAKSMGLSAGEGEGQDILVISGTDAAGALIWRDGAWGLTDCGY